ncbi:6-bladed beta-propeller [Membranihabitans marinus]|uniref:6-bladed beta-propeller n=1 Tax=Membranihabitans marinus TaxID=1227546 RepID=UPI001C99C3D6|nr:6-bladed beta-propeller [Membranihabitans marinus]
MSRENSYADSIIDIVGHIALESTEEALYAEMRKMYMTDSNIYILDKKPENLKLYNFTTKGVYVNKTMVGKGPGEVFHPVDFFVSKDKKDIYLWDILNKMVVFDSKLNYKTQLHMQSNVPIYNMAPLHNGKWLISKPEPPVNGDDNVFFYAITDSTSFNSIEKLFVRRPKDYHDLFMKHPISRWYFGDIKFVEPFGYRILGLNDTMIYVAYEFDFRELSLSYKDISENDMSTILEMAWDGSKVVGIRNIIESRKAIGFTIMWDKKYEYVIYDKSSKNYITSIEAYNSGQLPHGKLMALDGEKNFVIVSSPSDFNSWKNNYGNSSAKKLTVETYDNDVLTIFSIAKTK